MTRTLRPFRLVVPLAAVLVLGQEAGAARSAPDSPAPSDTLRLTIDQAVERALAQGIEMRVAGARIDVASGQVREAFAEALPQIRGSVSYGRKFDSIFKASAGDTVLGPIFKNSPFGAPNSWITELSASQLLWSSGRVGAGVRAAHAVRRSVEAGRQQTADDVTRQVKSAYLQAAAAGQALAIVRAGLAQARAHLHQVELYRREGTRAEYDLIRAQVDAANQEPPVVAANNAWELAALELKRLMNVPLEQPIALETPLAFEGGLIPVVTDSALTGAQRAALAQAEADVEARRQLLRLERSARWPQLSLDGTVSQQAFPGEGEWPATGQFRRAVDATVKLEFPLFLGGRTFGAVQRATGEFHQAEYQRDLLKQTIGLEVASALQEVRRTLAELVARHGTVALSERAYHLATVRYSSGLSTQLEVSDAQFQMQTAELNQVRATRDYRAALVELEHAVGRPLPTVPRPLSEIAPGFSQEDQ